MTEVNSLKNIKKFHKNNKVRSILLGITYRETQTYYKNCFTKLNDVLPRDMANNYDLKLYLDNPSFNGNSGTNHEDLVETNIDQKFNTNTNNMAEFENKFVPIIIAAIIEIGPISSRKKVVGTKKLKNSEIFNFKYSKFCFDNDKTTAINGILPKMEDHYSKFKLNTEECSITQKSSRISLITSTTGTRLNNSYQGKYSKLPKKIPHFFKENLDEEQQQELYLHSLWGIVNNIKILSVSNIEKLNKARKTFEANAFLSLCDNLLPKYTDNLVYTSVIDLLPFPKHKHDTNNDNNDNNKNNDETNSTNGYYYCTKYKDESKGNFNFPEYPANIIYSVESNSSNVYSHIDLNKSYSNSFYSNSSYKSENSLKTSEEK